jgi:ornithine cyclodeaminase/alanine dehydrogenase-like protein (mu-crystallin family)
MQFLDDGQVRQLLDKAAVMHAVADAMIDLSAGRGSFPHRVTAGTKVGSLRALPAFCPSRNVLAAKLLTVFPGNRNERLPAHHSLIATFDPATGVPGPIMAADTITAWRTAAGSALATQRLARADAAVLAVLGTGPQALAHVEFVAMVRDFREVRIGGRDPAKVARTVAELESLNVRPCTIDEAVDGADVICATTTAESPIVRADRIGEGVHITSVGHVERGGELDAALYEQALVIVEHRDTAYADFPVGSSQLAQVTNRSAAVELGELLAGHHPGRTDDRQRTIYKSVGLGIQDAAVAGVVLRRLGRREPTTSGSANAT